MFTSDLYRQNLYTKFLYVFKSLSQYIYKLVLKMGSFVGKEKDF